MALPAFYHPALKLNDGLITLADDESRHASLARRLQTGSSVRVINGAGLLGEGEIAGQQGKQLQIRLSGVNATPYPERRVQIVVAPPKGERCKTMVAMLSQLGVWGISLLSSARTINKPGDKLLSKLQRVAIESCKQSVNPWLPTISALSFAELVQLIENQAAHWVLADQQGEAVSRIHWPAQSHILVGAEGGFSDRELAHLQALKVEKAACAGHILRIETAAVVMSAIALAQ